MKIAVWNIGHFNGGNGKHSTIPEEKTDAALSLFRAYIHDEIGADTLCLCEMSEVFARSDRGEELLAKDTLLCRYPYGYIGEQNNYTCNAVFSTLPFSEVTQARFVCNESVTFVQQRPTKATDSYYLKTSIRIDGVPVTLVVCHLAFDNGRLPDTVNTDQLHELVRMFSKEEHVIIVGDFNCHRFDYYNVLTEAGYRLGNDGSLATREEEPDNRALDNIVVKGVKAENVRVHRTSLSDHNALSADISLL